MKPFDKSERMQYDWLQFGKQNVNKTVTTQKTNIGFSGGAGSVPAAFSPDF